MTDFDFRAAREAVYTSGLDIYTRGVLMQIIDHMPMARPSVERIASRSAMSRDQVMREIKALESMGVLVVVRQFGKPSNYTLTNDWMSRIQGVPANETSCPEQPVADSNQSLPATPPVATSHGGSGYQPPPPVATSHTKQEIKQEDKQEGKQRETRRRATPTPAARSGIFFLPADWQPTEEQLAYAAENRVADLQALLAKFKTDCACGRKPSKNAASVSFDGIFWTYLRNEVKWAAERTAKGIGPRKTIEPQRGVDDHVSRGSLDDFEPPPSGSKVVPLRKAGSL